MIEPSIEYIQEAIHKMTATKGFGRKKRFKYELSMDAETCNTLVTKKKMDKSFVTKLH